MSNLHLNSRHSKHRWLAFVPVVLIATTLASTAGATTPLPTTTTTVPSTTAVPTTVPPTTVAATTIAPTTTPTSSVAPTTVVPSSTTSVTPPTTLASSESTTTAATPTTSTTTTTTTTTTTALPAGDIVALAEPGAGAVSLAKEASVAEVSPGESFSYTFTAGCSGLEQSCINAVLTDQIPADLDVTTLPPSTSDYDVSLVGNTLTVRFKIPLLSPPEGPNPPGSVGLPDGSSLNIVVGVQLPPESQVADGVTLTNSAQLTATGSDPVTDAANVVVDVPKIVNPVATKSWGDSSAVAGTGEPTTITLGVRNGSSSTADITQLVVEDATPGVFEKLDVTGLGAVVFPAGADQLVVLACTQPASACGNESSWVASPVQTAAPFTLPVAAADVTGVRFVFSSSGGGPLPYDATGGTVQVDMQLRDTLRSTGAAYQPTVTDSIQNCATPRALESELGLSAGADACSRYTVYPAQATIAVSKAFFSDTNGNFAADGRAVIGLDSPVSATTSVRNTSPFAVATLTIVEPSASSSSEYSKLDVTDLRIVFPAGATEATVTVDCGAGPVSTTYTAPPSTVSVPTGCAAAESVSVTFRGVDVNGDATIAEGATAQLGVHGTLNDTADATDVNAGPGATGDGVSNCADGAATSSINGVGSAAGNACATLTLWDAFSSLTGTKAAQLPSILPGLPRNFQLSFTNSGTIPATNVVMADPIDPAAPDNAFDSTRLADLVLPPTPAATAEVYDPDAGAYVPYVAGDTVLLTRARGFRVTVPQLGPGATYAMSFNVFLRDGVAAGTTFRNCAGIGSDAQAPAGFCSQILTVGTISSAASLGKALDPASSVRPQDGLPGQAVQIKLALQNTGTLFLRELTATDDDPAFYDAVDVTGQVLVNFPPGSDRVRVDACTGACGDADWVTGTVTGSASPGLPTGVALDDVRGVRVVFTAVPVPTPLYPAGDEYRIRPGTNFPTTGACRNTSVCIGFKPRIDLRSAPGTLVPGTITDTASGSYESRAQDPGVPALIPATSATHELTDGTAVLQMSKSPNRTASPGESIPFVLRVANTGTGAIPELSIVEPFPAGLDYKPASIDDLYEISYSLPVGAPEPPEVVISQQVDPVTGQTTELRWDFPGWDLVPGAVVRLQFIAVLAPGVTAGDVIENRAGATGDRDNLACNLSGVPRPGEVDDDPLFGDGHYCTSGALVTTGEGNAFQTQKWVAGDPSLGLLNVRDSTVVPVGDPLCPRLDVGGQAFTRYPCVARVLPGQGFDYYIQLRNSGTNPATEVRLVDVFPHPGDTGVLLTGQSRGTEWSQAPTLLSAVSLTGKGSGDIAYTSGAGPACTTDLSRPPVACPAGAWPLSGYDPSATAFRAIITFAADDLLGPGQTTGLRFRMAAPANPGAATDDVAWNSFAHTEFFRSGQAVAQLPPTEPIKVGVAIVYGGFTITKTVDDPSGGSAGLSFDIVYECAVTPEAGDPVVVAEGTVTLAGGERTTIDAVPAGATCLVWEPDAQGLVSNAPDRDSAVAVPIPIDSTVEIPTADIVNTAQPPPTTSTSTTVPPASTTTTEPLPSTTSATTTTVDPGAGTSTTTVVAPTTTTPTGGVGATGPTTTNPDAGVLPRTGSSTHWPLSLAGLLVGVGALVVVATTRRRRAGS